MGALPLFGSHGRGDIFSVKSGNRSTFLWIYSECWNQELCDFASNPYNKVPTIKNMSDRMELNRRIRRDISNEIGFIASHFDETSSSLTVINICLIDVIFSRDGLKINSENLICSFVASKF
jgi:hypothetical protein